MRHFQFPHLSLVGICSIAAMLLSSLTCAAQVVEDFPITPYRPSVSSPAELPVTGQLEMELGGLSTRDDMQRRHSLPYQLKLAFSPEWGVLMGGELMVLANDGAGMVDRGLGDTTLVLKRAFIVNDDRAFGLELAVKTPTAAKAPRNRPRPPRRPRTRACSIWSMRTPRACAATWAVTTAARSTNTWSRCARWKAVSRTSAAVTLKRPTTPRRAPV